MDQKHSALRTGVLISLVLLGVFMALQGFGSPIMDLATHWIALAILPILVALVVGGYIKTFKGWGIELEAALKEDVGAGDHSEDVEITDAGHLTKGGPSLLTTGSEAERLGRLRLIFFLDRAGFYFDGAVENYLQTYPNLQQFVILAEDRKFLATLPVSATKPDLDLFLTALGTPDLKALQQEYGAALDTSRITKQTSQADAYKACRASPHGSVAVVDETGTYLASVSSAELAQKIADKAIKVAA